MPELVDFILRHPRERKSKCSLQPLLGRPDLRFETASLRQSVDASGYLLLSIAAPVLSEADDHLPLLILDSTWRLLPQLEQLITGNPVYRSLPPEVQTAYPRTSKLSPDPARGLASIEALFVARRLQKRPVNGLLDHYFWRSPFLAQFRF